MAKGITTKGSLRPTLSDKYPNTGPPSKTPIKAAEPIAPVQNTSKSISGLRCINAGPITVKIYPSNKDVPPQYKVSLFKKALNFSCCILLSSEYEGFLSLKDLLSSFYVGISIGVRQEPQRASFTQRTLYSTGRKTLSSRVVPRQMPDE